MNERIPEADVVAAVIAAVPDADPDKLRRNLKFWRQKKQRLLPEVDVRHRGKAHGTVTLCRPWVIPIAKRLVAMPKGGSLVVCLWALWLDDDLPPEAAAWLIQRIAEWSGKLLRKAKSLIGACDAVETKRAFTRKPRRNAPAPLRKIYKRLGTGQEWYDFMGVALADLVSKRRLNMTAAFLAASERLTGRSAEELLPPPGVSPDYRL
jgi:hypothetical protein